MWHDRKRIPNDLKEMTNKDEKLTLSVHRQDKVMMLILYINKKKASQKNIIALMTMHNKVKVTNDQWCKWHVLVMYDHTKGGVVVVDLISTHHSTRIKSKQWPLNTFVSILDTMWTNANIILADNKSSFSNFEFTYQVGKTLVLPIVQPKFEIRNGIQIAVIEKIRHVLGIAELNRQAQPKAPLTHSNYCYRCVEMIVGKANYKLSRKKMNNKLKINCQRCKNFICKKYQEKIEYICSECLEEQIFPFS